MYIYMYVYMHRAYMNIQSNIPRGNTFVQYTCTYVYMYTVHEQSRAYIVILQKEGRKEKMLTKEKST